MIGLKRMKKGNIKDFLNFLPEIILKEKAICCSLGYMSYWLTFHSWGYPACLLARQTLTDRRHSSDTIYFM
jgi:hypothetical protein